MIFRSPTAIVRSSIIAPSTTRAVAVERFGPHVCRGTAGSLSDAEIREDAAEKIFVTEFAGDFAECGERNGRVRKTVWTRQLPSTSSASGKGSSQIGRAHD